MPIRFLILFVFIIGLNIARFMWLEVSPPGFYVDESAAAINSLCVADEGTDYAGNRFPLISVTEFFGAVNAPYMYSGAAWVTLFGDSVSSLRAMAGFYTIVTIAGIFAIAWSLLSLEAGVVVAFVASLSPWAFQFSRISWDPPLAPAFMVWGVYFLVCRRSIRSAIGASLSFALCAYAYQAARAQAPLLIAGLLILIMFRQTRSIKNSGIFVGFLICAVYPLVSIMTSASVLSRFNTVGIFSAGYLQSIGSDSYLSIVPLFVENVLKHFSLKFLILTGDTNLRHSTQAIGQLSPIDFLSFAIGAGLLLEACAQRNKLNFRGNGFCFSVVGILGVVTGIVPAALTWEGVPHALRSIGAWPFVSLLAGGILSVAIERWRFAMVPLVGVTAVYLFYFLPKYFVSYPTYSRAWYDADVDDRAREAALSGDWAQFIATHNEYPKSALRYYLMHYRGDSCSESRDAVGR